MIDLSLVEQAQLLGLRDMRIATLEKRLAALETAPAEETADELAERRATHTDEEAPPGA